MRATRAGAAAAVVADALHALTQRGRDVEAAREACVRGDVVTSAGLPLGPDDLVEVGQQLFIHQVAADEPGWTAPLRVLWEGPGAVVVDKPAGIATTPRGAFVARSVTVAARRQWGNDAVTPAHRLDRLTSGCLLLVTDPQARRTYQEAFATGRAHKSYLALTPAAGVQAGDTFTWQPRLRIPARGGRVSVGPGGVPTRTDAAVLEVRQGRAMWRLTPTGGKMHQLRVTLADAGFPILGDPLYGAGEREGERLFLHAVALEVDTDPPVEAMAPLPSWWEWDGDSVVSLIDRSRRARAPEPL